MHGISDSALLRLFELSAVDAPSRRAVRLIAASDAGFDESGAALLSIGRRDRFLLELRLATFGPALECTAACPQCGERLEFSLDARDLLEQDRPGGAATVALEYAGTAVTARLPTSKDLIALGTTGTEHDLLDRCLTEVRCDDVEIGGPSLDPDLVVAIDDELADADPGARLAIALQCPVCTHAWSQLFDVVDFFWAELEARVERILREIHTLAGAYGWTEAEVLQLPTARRQRYLDLVNG
ncbi:MAG TPA: hypothetical protein VIV88_00500 [Gemmatimonadales bacterium]|jgi:hypothetical protein